MGAKKGLFKKMFKNSVPPIDLKRYTDLEDMYGYIGFIDKEGGFYRVRKIGSTDCGHGEWAYYFLDSIKNKVDVRPSLKLFNNINCLLDDPRFEMALLYEISDSSKGENSQIEYSASVGDMDMPFKQREVIRLLLDHQNKRNRQRQNSSKTL